MHRRHRRSAGFTLLELVVVLGILAILTTLATRALVQVEDQHRYDASQRSLTDIQFAILGDPNERAGDGTRVVSGFVADMGRLPRALLSPAEGQLPERLNLRALWDPAGSAAFNVRTATPDHGVAAVDADPDVQVPGGWHGPYLRLPIGGVDVLDGWGNPYSALSDPSPPNPETTGYARLRTAGGAPVTAETQEIHGVTHLGADGKHDTGVTPYPNTDLGVDFTGLFAAELKTTVDVHDEHDDPSPGDGTERIVVRVFAPDPFDAAKIKVFKAAETMTTAPVLVPGAAALAPTITGLTIGRRAVRAYLTTVDGTLIAKSPIKYVVFQPGINFVTFTIRRSTVLP